MKATVRFSALYLLFIIAALYLNLHSDVSVPINRPFSEFPRSQSDWNMTGQSEFSSAVLDILRPTDYLSRQYTDTTGNKVTLYVGYHSGGKGSGGIHSPKHCLPGSGWLELYTKRGTLKVGNEQIQVVRAVYQKGGQKELYLYWFQVKGKTLSDEYSLKLAEVTNSLFYRRRDSAFVRISLSFDADMAKAQSVADRFAVEFYPVLTSFFPR